MKKKGHKYIFVMGGVMSGVGKGVASASIGKVLQANGYKVNLVKVDPYLNVDAGTMNPTEHGETFVLRSGLETDQDMGNYERFLGRDLPEENYVTSGMVYSKVIERERNLEYDGKCVEAIPHVRDEIVDRFEKAAAINGSQISVIEIGGTVGDFQNAMFIEAARVMKSRNPDDILFIMVTYLPIPSKVGEMKTKPTQNAIRQLNSYGVQPDFVIGRSEEELDERRKDKIAEQCNIRPDHVISAPDIDSIYDVPLNFERDGLSKLLLKALKLKKKPTKHTMKEWAAFAKKVHNPKKEVHIAVIGKYFSTGDFVLSDAYISVIEAIKFSAYNLGAKPILTWISSGDFETGKKKLSELKKFDGIIIPGGFGTTGIEGKIKVIKYIRENKIPYFGLCYGMQLAVVEYARNVLGLKGATTREMDKDAEHLVIDIMEDQKEKIKNRNYGGTMRLGVYPAQLKKGTIARKAYGKDLVEERHRHRYEVNPEYIGQLETAGLVFSGASPNKKLMEIAELSKSVHPFFLGTQFHPELQARPLLPHPLFTEFVKVCLEH
ncbi:MAG: CTP synthase [Candidatus Pacebacteria bacterium]|nr:CTP synthase [Candidatus Paceibacterota bacterium]